MVTDAQRRVNIRRPDRGRQAIFAVVHQPKGFVVKIYVDGAWKGRASVERWGPKITSDGENFQLATVFEPVELQLDYDKVLEIVQRQIEEGRSQL